jgi:hypothetical protein
MLTHTRLLLLLLLLLLLPKQMGRWLRWRVSGT